jgi:hypothetical protein
MERGRRGGKESGWWGVEDGGRRVEDGGGEDDGERRVEVEEEVEDVENGGRRVEVEGRSGGWGEERWGKESGG